MARNRKTKDGFMSLVLVCFVLFCAVKVVDIQQNISEKEAELQSLENKIELQAEKNLHSAEVRRLEAEMKRVKAMIAVDMGTYRRATYEDASGIYTITMNPSAKPVVLRNQIDRMKIQHPDLYAEYVTFSESRRLTIKKSDPAA